MKAMVHCFSCGLVLLIASDVCIPQCEAANTPLLHASDKDVQIQELISRVRRTYRVGVCVENVFVATFREIDVIRVDADKYELSKLKLDELLRTLTKDHKVSWRVEGRCVLLRTPSYDAKSSPLNRMIDPFKLKGTVWELMKLILAANPDLGYSSTIDPYSRESDPIDISFDVKTSIEDVMLCVADKYSIDWQATVNPNPSPPFKIGVHWIFSRGIAR